MRPRDKASGKAAKTQHPKTLKGHNKTGRVRSSRIARKETNVARLTRERDEALEQQRTTADVLKIVSRSSVDLEAVLDMLVETAARLCRADQTNMYRRRDDKLHHLVAACGFSEEAKRFALAHPLSPGRGTTTGRVILERRAVHIPDVLQDPEFTYRDGQKAIGFRTVPGIPLLREDALLGILARTMTLIVNGAVHFSTRWSAMAPICTLPWEP
jgi:GAF domain